MIGLPASTLDAPHDPHAPFRFRDFRMFYLARLANNLGTNVMIPALGWQVYAITRDPFALGLLGLATFVPVATMALPSGQVADRLERRAVYRVAQLSLLAAAVLLVGLTLADVRSVAPFYVAAALFGASKTFSAPVANAWMPHLVPRSVYPGAVAWTQSAFQLSSIAGPAIAGVLLATFGTAVTHGIAGLFYVGSFAMACCVATRSQGQDRRPLGLAHLLGGLTYIRDSRLILGATTLDMFAVLMGGAVAMLPVFADQVLHVDEVGFGLLRSAPALGATAVALLVAHRPFRSHVGLRMFAAVTLFGLATIAFGFSQTLLLSLLVLIVLGAADMVGSYIRATLVQLATHDDMRGRVSSINLMFGSAKVELGEVQAGLLAGLWGVVPAVVLGGICTLAISAIWAWRFPELRRLDRLTVEPVDAADDRS